MDLEARLDAVARDGVGEELRGEMLALLCGDHPVNDVAAEEVEDDVGAEEDALACGREFRDVPGPDLVGCGGRQLRLRVDMRRTLVAPLAALVGLGEHAVHRADGAEVFAPAEQGRVHLAGRLVDELVGVQDLEQSLALGVAETPSTRRARGRRRLRLRRLTAAIEARAADPEGVAGGGHGQMRLAGFDKVHQLFSSLSGSARPRISCAFFWALLTFEWV